MSEESVTRCIKELAEGNSQAETEIWRRYFERLIGLARAHLASLPRRTRDEEDVALSAMNTFFEAAKAGRFPRLLDRNDLWNLLLIISARKATAERRRHYAESRPDRWLTDGDSPSDKQALLEAAWGREPSPAFAVHCGEDLGRRLQQLPDDVWRKIAIWRLEGYTNREIAGFLSTYEVKVERKLRLIRKCWSSARDS